MRSMQAMIVLLAGSVAFGAEARGPVGHWPMDRRTGNELRDAGPNKLHGRIHGAQWVKRPGGFALSFDGVDDYVEFGAPPALDLTAQVTVDVWVCPQDVPRGEPGLFGKYIDSSYALTFYSNGQCYWYINHGSNHAGAPLAMGEWQHVAGTFDGATLRLYVNGREIESRVSSFKSVNHGADLLMGTVALNAQAVREGAATLPFFKGLIGAARIHDRALSAEEIRNIFIVEGRGYDRGVVAMFPPPPDVLQGWEALTGKESTPNLALAAYGGWTVTSSNANLHGLYSKNLNDGDLRTPWRSYQETREEWVDLAWDFEVLVNRLRLLQNTEHPSPNVAASVWVRDAWQPAANVKTERPRDLPSATTLSFDTVATRRVRLFLRSDAPQYHGLYEAQAYGPAQPLARVTFSGAHQWMYLPVGTASRNAPASGAVRVDAFALSPDAPAPGSEVRLTLRMTPLDALAEDVVFVATIGEREVSFNTSDYTAARILLRPPEAPPAWPRGEAVAFEQTAWLPVYAPDGALDVRLHAVSGTGAPRLVGPDGADLPDGRVGRVTIRRFADAAPPEVFPQRTAAVDTSNGTVIALDGRKVPPFLFALQTPSFERYHYYAQAAGVKLFHLQVYPYRIDAGDYQARNYAYIAQHMRNLVRVDPDACALIEVDLRTSAAWQEAHPQGCLYTHDGRRMHESFCAKEYRDEVASYLGNLVRFVQAQPWGGNVIGYIVELGEPEGVLSGSPDIGDYNPQAIEAFRDFVRNRYGGDAARLRAAYNDPALTFETVFPTHEKIMERGAQGGCFLDPKTQRLAIDYHEFVATIIPTFLTDHCGRLIKELTQNGALVGSYWVYLTEDIAHGQASHQGNHSHAHYVLRSPYVDFFSSPFSYGSPARHAGEPYRTFQPHDAVRLNGKIHIPECDHRTFRAGSTLHGRNFSREDTLGIIRRDMATALMRGMGAWFSDWTNNATAPDDRRQAEPFFLDDQILGQINSLRRVHEESMTSRRPHGAEAAVFVSGPSYYYHDNHAQPIYASLIYDSLYRAMPLAGAPFHELILEDVAKPEVRDAYKCCVFLNAFHLTEEQRAAVKALASDGRTLVWVYAPGYAGDAGLSLEGMQEATGFRFEADHTPQALSCKFIASATPLADGLKDKSLVMTGGTVSPRFIPVDADMRTEVIAVYPDGKPAVAARRFGTHTSVYVGVPAMSTDFFRSLLRFAGCHLYVDQPVYMDASPDFLMLTNTFERPRRLDVRLPKTCTVSDLETNQPVAEKVGAFTVDIARGETLLYRLRAP